MSLFGTLGTGVSGLNVSELAISTTGHNISNANNDYYSRQRVVTQANEAFHTSPGDIGTGVRVKTIVRIHDEFVYTRLKDSSNSLSYDTFSKKTLEEVAKYFPDLEGAGIGSDIENYFSSWNDLASHPDDVSQKIALVQNSITLAGNLRDSRSHVRDLQDSLNDQLKTNVDEVNRIGKQISELNKSISKVESLEVNRANDLRDQRDGLELTLTKLIDVSIFKGDMTTENHINPNLTDQGSQYHSNVAGHSFVDGFTFHPLVINNTGNESSYFSVYSKSQDDSTIEITDKLNGGKIGSMLDLRGRIIDPSMNAGYPTDGTLQGYVDSLDSFAKTFIEHTNNIYAKSAQDGMESVNNDALMGDTVLVNHSETLKKGTFDVLMYDKKGNEVGKKSITINGLTVMHKKDSAGVESPDSIVGQFNKDADDNGDNNSNNDIDDYFQAGYSYDKTSDTGSLSFRLEDPLSGYTIAIEDHGTNFAGVIGLSSFLRGDDASSMDVATKYKNDPAKMNAYSAPIEGNNVVANDMVQFQYDEIDFHRKENSTVSSSIDGFYRLVTTQISTDGESANRNFETSSALFNTVNDEFQSISGVNIDEELTNLMKFQASYGANAKVITTIDQMLDTLLGLKR